MRTLFSTRRSLIIVTTTTAVLLALAVIGVVGLLRGNEPSPAPTATPTQWAPPGDPDVRPSGDGVVFARRAASVLFDWDTTSHSGPSGIIDALLAVGDPSGQDMPGLFADAARYLPTDEQWQQLAEYQTTQRLEIASAGVPAAWADIQSDTDNPLPEGTVAITIEGTRIREGKWFDQATRKEFPVAFTVFLSCPPATESICRLLRLSVLGEPLR